MEEADLNTFINTLLDPVPLESLYASPFKSGTIFIDVFTNPEEEPEQIPLLNIFPFMTVFDIKLAIYAYFLERGDERAHPDFVFIGYTYSTDEKSLETINYNWSFSATPNQAVSLDNPINIASGNVDIDVRFVEANGSRKNIRRTDTERITLENKFPKRVPRILRAYFYDALESLIPGERPLSELDWNGRLYPYFPTLSLGNDTITEEQKKTGKKMVNNFLLRSKFFQKIERDFVMVERPLPPVKLSAVHYLRLNYLQTQDFKTSVEIVFYETHVNKHRPYMRLMPVENTPISKIHMFENSDEPNLEDPNLLYSWSQDKNPTPERDYLMAKILLRKRDVNKIPLYSTLRLFDDGTADITVEPPHPLKKLTPDELSKLSDTPTEGLGERLTKGIEGIAHLRGLPLLKNANFTFSMNTQGYFNIPSTVAEFRQKLPIMSAIFQEIPSIEKEKTFITLRYKLVSNYSRENSIQIYITQLLALETIEGEHDSKEIIAKIKKEFQISTNEAREQYAKNLEGTSDFILTNPDTKDYNSFQDAGIDITVYQFSKIFLFRMYRLDSYQTIQRIITFLSILFGAPVDDIRVEDKDIKIFNEGDKVLNVRAEESIRRVDDEVKEEVDDAGSDDDFKSVKEEEEGGIKGEEAEAVADVFEEEFPDYLDLMGEPEGTRLEENEHEFIETTTKSFVPAPAPAPAPAKKVESGPVKGVETYFSEKLKEADRSLFDFHKTHPDLKKYVTQCASNLTRQPAVLSFEQLEIMKEEYAEELSNGTIKFYIFPLDKDPKKDAYDPPKEYYTIMRYGSSPANQNYYLCSQYFCIRDEMLVRKVELEGTKLRPKHYVKQANGTMRTTKAANTCPICEGGLIKSRRYPGVNETVIQRDVKANAEGRHIFIRFLKKTNHPDGHYLPCCFLEDQPLRYGDPQFPEPTQDIFDARREPAIGDEEEEEILQMAEDQKSPLPYQTTLLMAKTASIVGVEKMPLDPEIKKVKKSRRGKLGAFDELDKVTEYVPPQIGLLPTKLNEYFSQNPIDIVSRTFNPQKLKPKSKGFLRVGVDNRAIARNDSFLAAVAPFFHCNSARELKEILRDRIQPRLFMGLNFGNLLLEFYDPMWKPKYIFKGEPNGKQLQEWARNSLKIEKNSVINNYELIMRAFKSYDKFCYWLFKTDIKEYRQFAHFFSLPGIMRVGVQTEPDTPVRDFHRPGIIFIVLEILASGEMKVRCPPYPISEEMYKNSDFGFIMKHHSGVWEPIFYYNNDSNPDDVLNRATLTFSTGKKRGPTLTGISTDRVTWPDIVKKRVDEFRSQCSIKQGDIGIYTSNYRLKSTKVLPLNVIRSALSKHDKIVLYGLLRDTYNHVAALVYKDETGGLIAVPVIEDGISYSSNTDIHGSSNLYMLILDVKIIVDWTDYTPGSMGQVVSFYRQYLEPEFSEQYKVKRYVKRKLTNTPTIEEPEILAIQLESGIFIPVAPHKKFTKIPVFPDAPEEVEELEWEINREIAIGTNTPDESITEIQTKEMDEAFQHLRITFSNWLNSKPEGGVFRDELDKLLSSREMSLYEKRKRVEIFIGKTVEEWITDKDEDAVYKPSILRVDCTMRAHSECSGSCSWSDERGKCLIHASPVENPETGKVVAAARVLLLRLIEELIRFTNKRREIFNREVTRIAITDEPVREGDQYIIPEKSEAWTELLRSEWLAINPETPKFLEEMRVPPKQAPLAPITDPTELPVTLKTLLGADDPITARLRLYISPSGTIGGLLPVFREKEDKVEIYTNDIELTDKTLGALVKKVKIPIFQYDLRTDPPKIIGSKLWQAHNKKGYAIIVLSDKPPAIVVTNPKNPALLNENELPVEIIKRLKEPTLTKTVFAATPK